MTRYSSSRAIMYRAPPEQGRDVGDSENETAVDASADATEQMAADD